MHRLAAYLADNAMSPDKFAELIGVDRSTVFRWIEGKSMPRKRHLRAIARATNGAVTAEHFVADDDLHAAA